MTTETVMEKARRYLASGRVCVVEARPGYARAIVRGEQLYEVEETPAGRTCTCPVPAPRMCSHALAVGLVTPPVLAPPLGSESRRYARSTGGSQRCSGQGSPPTPLPFPELRGAEA